MEPRISVVIPTRHRNDLLASCLDRLAPGAQSMPFANYEVIVTDDGSATTAEHLVAERYPWARWVAGPRSGPAANRNGGAASARGEWLVFTDDDCLPTPGWLEGFAGEMASSAVALEGAITPLGDLGGDLIHCPTNTSGGCFWSANIAVRRQYYWRLGGFDASYPMPAYEDTDLRMRIERDGPIPFVLSAAVQHPVKQLSLLTQLRQMRAYAKAFAHHARKHGSPVVQPNATHYVLAAAKTQVRHAVVALRDLHWRSATLAVSQMAFGIPMSAVYIYRRKGVYRSGGTAKVTNA